MYPHLGKQFRNFFISELSCHLCKLQVTKIFKQLNVEGANQFHTQFMCISWEVYEILFSWAPKSLQTLTAAMKLKDACSFEGKL